MSSNPIVEDIVHILEDHGIRPSRELIASIQKYLDECGNDGNHSSLRAEVDYLRSLTGAALKEQ